MTKPEDCTAVKGVALNDGLGRCAKHGAPLDVPTDCSRCRGEGEIEDDQDFGMEPPFVKCWECGGSGAGLPDCEICLIEDDDA